MNKEELKAEIAKCKRVLRKIEKDEAQLIRDTQITPTEEGKMLARYREAKSLLVMAENDYNVAKQVSDGLEAQCKKYRERMYKIEEKAEKAGVDL